MKSPADLMMMLKCTILLVTITVVQSNKVKVRSFFVDDQEYDDYDLGTQDLIHLIRGTDVTMLQWYFYKDRSQQNERVLSALNTGVPDDDQYRSVYSPQPLDEYGHQAFYWRPSRFTEVDIGYLEREPVIDTPFVGKFAMPELNGKQLVLAGIQQGARSHIAKLRFTNHVKRLLENNVNVPLAVLGRFAISLFTNNPDLNNRIRGFHVDFIKGGPKNNVAGNVMLSNMDQSAQVSFPAGITRYFGTRPICLDIAIKKPKQFPGDLQSVRPNRRRSTGKGRASDHGPLQQRTRSSSNPGTSTRGLGRPSSEPGPSWATSPSTTGEHETAEVPTPSDVPTVSRYSPSWRPPSSQKPPPSPRMPAPSPPNSPSANRDSPSSGSLTDFDAVSQLLHLSLDEHEFPFSSTRPGFSSGSSTSLSDPPHTDSEDNQSRRGSNASLMLHQGKNRRSEPSKADFRHPVLPISQTKRPLSRSSTASKESSRSNPSPVGVLSPLSPLFDSTLEDILKQSLEDHHTGRQQTLDDYDSHTDDEKIRIREIVNDLMNIMSSPNSDDSMSMPSPSVGYRPQASSYTGLDPAGAVGPSSPPDLDAVLEVVRQSVVDYATGNVRLQGRATPPTMEEEAHVKHLMAELMAITTNHMSLQDQPDYNHAKLYPTSMSTAGSRHSRKKSPRKLAATPTGVDEQFQQTPTGWTGQRQTTYQESDQSPGYDTIPLQPVSIQQSGLQEPQETEILVQQPRADVGHVHGESLPLMTPWEHHSRLYDVTQHAEPMNQLMYGAASTDGSSAIGGRHSSSQLSHTHQYQQHTFPPGNPMLLPVAPVLQQPIPDGARQSSHVRPVSVHPSTAVFGPSFPRKPSPAAPMFWTGTPGTVYYRGDVLPPNAIYPVQMSQTGSSQFPGNPNSRFLQRGHVQNWHRLGVFNPSVAPRFTESNPTHQAPWQHFYRHQRKEYRHPTQYTLSTNVIHQMHPPQPGGDSITGLPQQVQASALPQPGRGNSTRNLQPANRSLADPERPERSRTRRPSQDEPRQQTDRHRHQ